tara:strand:+ start:126 stop:2153 length:2028 start_codon:yes stop_codon:yes gene_type:complete
MIRDKQGRNQNYGLSVDSRYNEASYGYTRHGVPEMATIDKGPWYRSYRFGIFIATFLVVAIAGLTYCFARSPVYRSATILLTVTPDQVGGVTQQADLQHVLIQQNLLSGHNILRATLEKMLASGFAAESLPQDSTFFQDMISVSPLSETNLVEVAAEGPDPLMLPELLNNLMVAYSELRINAINEAISNTNKSLLQQQLTLEELISTKRDELAEFRADNDILTLGDNENAVSTRLRGITEALNKAIEAKVNAQASLEAAQAAIARGDPVVPPSDERAFADLQKRQRELREKLTELDSKYTREYMALQPSMKAIPDQLAAVEAQIRHKLSVGKDLVIADAQRQYDMAARAEKTQQKALEDYKQTAVDFTTSFSTHEAKKEELLQLEEQFRDAKEQLTKLEIRQQQNFPQFKIIEPAFEPTQHIRPHYWRDAGIVVLVAFGLGLLAIWMYEFFRRSKREAPKPDYWPGGFVTITDPRLSSPTTMMLDRASETLQSLPEPTPTPQEKTEEEIVTLLTSADPAGRQLITLLLSGVSISEVIHLTASNYDPVLGTLAIQSQPPRVLSLPANTQNALNESNGLPRFLDLGAETTREHLEAIITCAAVDAGLPEPLSFNATSLEDTYISYLVRQGIRLSDLPEIIGEISMTRLSSFSQLSPPRSGLPLDQVDVVYPALKSPR